MKEETQHESEKKPYSEVVKVSAVITMYFAVSLSMVFLNKLVFKSLNFPFALLLTWIQFIVAILLSVIAGSLRNTFPILSIFPAFEFNLEIARKVLPLTVIYIAMIVFNNLCLQYVQVSFYQVARSLTILWSALFTKLIIHKSVSKLRIVAIVVVFAGFLFGTRGEINFEIRGLIFGVLSSIFVALYGIYVKKVLPDLDNNEWKLLIYNTTLAIVILLPIVILNGEYKAFLSDSGVEFNFKTISILILTGIFGWLINIAIFMQIKYTSPLTNSISGTVKAAVQTVLGVLFFGDQITTFNFYGIVLVIGGSFWYGRISYNENMEEKLKEQQAKNVAV